MKKEIKDLILKWIFENHEHHIGGETSDRRNIDPYCEDGDEPYVNSLKLEEFIKSIKEN